MIPNKNTSRWVLRDKTHLPIDTPKSPNGKVAQERGLKPDLITISHPECFVLVKATAPWKEQFHHGTVGGGQIHPPDTSAGCVRFCVDFTPTSRTRTIE